MCCVKVLALSFAANPCIKGLICCELSGLCAGAHKTNTLEVYSGGAALLVGTVEYGGLQQEPRCSRMGVHRHEGGNREREKKRFHEFCPGSPRASPKLQRETVLQTAWLPLCDRKGLEAASCRCYEVVKDLQGSAQTV